MSSAQSNRFSAAGSALGYLVQVEYALLIALQRMESDVELRLSVETVDDITFDVDGKPLELWQTKHHIARHGSLGDASPDIWKTLHNWIETSGNDTTCFLFTTVTAPTGSAASLLGPVRSKQDLLTARKKLDAVARAGGNASLALYYTRYLKLSVGQRTDLLSRVTVIDGAVAAAGITDRLVASVRKATLQQRRLPLVERLRGWWHGRVLTHLTRIAEGKVDWITLSEIEDELLSIAQSLRDKDLPVDFSDQAEPTQAEVDEKDGRIFVDQLKLIDISNSQIREAVYDQNRAFLQRSRWQRNQLLGLHELETYDKLLRGHWKRVFLPLEEPSDVVSDDEKRRNARALYGKMLERDLPDIRSEVRSGYVPFGSLHVLSDRLEIGWHPDWSELMEPRRVEVGTIEEMQERS